MHLYKYTCITACTLLVLQVAQVLAHYLTINQLNATADCCQQTALEGSEPSAMILHLSEQGDATSRIMANLFWYQFLFHLLCPQMVRIMATVGLWQYIVVVYW